MIDHGGDDVPNREGHAPWLEDDIWTFKRPAWQADAACRGSDPELFYPTKAQTKKQKQFVQDICNGCPVKRECRDFAMRTHEVLGTWGGLTQQDRKRLRGVTKLRPRSLTNEELGLPARQPLGESDCEWCGTVYAQKEHGQKYCSRVCASEAFERRRVKRSVIPQEEESA